jgi:signal transduction histidine kinase
LHELNENLDRNEELLSHMSDIGKIGGWEYSKGDGHLLWTSQLFSIIETEKKEVPTLEEWNLMYAPEVRSLVVKRFNNCLSRREGFELELPFITSKENRIWVKIIAEAKVKDDQAVGISGIFQNITKEKELKESLIKINEELDARMLKQSEQLEQVNKEMETFSYTVSHDLRAPLRAIEGFSKAMKENYAGILDEDGERWLNYIVDNTDKMGGLISDILTYSRIARAEIQEEELNMNLLVEEKFDLLKAQYRGIVLKINVEKLPKALGDRSLVGQVWLQLLSNALKFSTTKEEVCIDVSGKMENNCVTYKVKDQGAGFDQRYVDKIYVIFQRLHADDEFSGSGVGLAMVDKILKKHGGKISAESELGVGTSISFTLPL